MKRYLGTLLLLAMTIAAATISAPAQSGISGTLGGTVTSETGAALAGATVTARGPVTYTATSDSTGTFTIANVVPGPYQVSVSKGGFSRYEGSVDVPAGTKIALDIRLAVASFSSLKTIANVRATAGGKFNTSTASVSVVSAAQFELQGATQVGPVLSQIPGVQISLPGSDANAAVPGAITVPNVRNGLSYETATMIDGHPVAVGGYGDYVVTFLNPALLQSAEVVKGPGADSPTVTGAINGSINFRTKDPTATLQTFYSFGAHNFGGGVYAIGGSDTILNGRLGFVVGIAGDNNFSAVNNTPVYFDPGSGSGYIGGTNLYPYGCGGPNPLLHTNPNQFYSRVYNDCTAVATTTMSGQFNAQEELLKLRYKLSDRSYLTASYFGGQANANQSGNLSNVVQSVFDPGAGYTGSLKPGSLVDVLSAAYNSLPQYETNNEPIFQMEFSTAFKDDTFIARFYHATIDRVIQTGLADPFSPVTQFSNIYGTLNVPLPPFNGGSYGVAQYNYFNQVEFDRLTGYSAEYTHPFGANDELSMAINYNNNSTQDYYNDFSYGGNQCYIGSATAGTPPNSVNAGCYNTSTSLPTGSGQNFTTLMLRDVAHFSSTFSGMLTLYQNIYHSSYPTNCANYTTVNNTVCTPDGHLVSYTFGTTPSYVSTIPVNFGSTTLHSFDPRAGLTWRPFHDLSVRASAGSSIAPPYLAILGVPNNVVNVPAQYSNGAVATQTLNSGNLQPETAFGYDLGADYAFKDGVTFASTDFFLTNLFNQFFDSTYPSGKPCGSYCSQHPNTPLYYSQYINLANARYEGIELTVQRTPQTGWGYTVAGSTQRGYPYNISPIFFCAFKVSVKHPCVPANYNANLNVVPGDNFYGEYINNSGGTTSGVDNQSVPYLQGNASVSYTFRNHAYLSFGETLYGKNNSFNRPPFGVAYATASYPLNKDFAFQVSGYNIFNAYSQLFPLYGGGVTVPLVNGQSAGTLGNVLGPARYLFLVTKAFGSGQ